MYDAVMIGSGPAGLSAALYTSRANLRTLVIGKDRGALEKADRIENYFGMAEPISGCELVENTKTQAKALAWNLQRMRFSIFPGTAILFWRGRTEPMRRWPYCLPREPGGKP